MTPPNSEILMGSGTGVSWLLVLKLRMLPEPRVSTMSCSMEKPAPSAPIVVNLSSLKELALTFILGVPGPATIGAPTGQVSRLLVGSTQLVKLSRLAGEPVVTDPPMWLLNRSAGLGGAVGAVKF